MGEVSELLLEGLEELFPIGFEPAGNQTSIIVGRKTYVVGGSDDGGALSFRIQIFDKPTGKWSIPTVLGMKPAPSKAHSAMLLNEDRILILKRDSTMDDCIWFLEVDTPFVREQKKILGGEVVAWSKGVKGNSPKPVVISGPSGVGKGTLITKLMRDYPSTFGFSVSHTTRAPREKETDGVHYHFTKRSIMENDIKDGKFLETAHVHGNLYGTSIEAVEAVTDSGKRCILDIDVQGTRSVKARCLEVISIFICPPSFEELEKRLRARGTETEEQVQKRLRNANTELMQGKSSGLFDHILVNDDLDTCYSSLKKILGLDWMNSNTYQPTYQNQNPDADVKNIELHVGQLVSEMDKKILIHCGTTEDGKASNSLFVLDVSSLSGGAPGRTRGIKGYAVDPFANGMKALQQI